MRGVVNVRGQATPVVDLRLKFGLAQAADTVQLGAVRLTVSPENRVARALYERLGFTRRETRPDGSLVMIADLTQP